MGTRRADAAVAGPARLGYSVRQPLHRATRWTVPLAALTGIKSFGAGTSSVMMVPAARFAALTWSVPDPRWGPTVDGTPLSEAPLQPATHMLLLPPTISSTLTKSSRVLAKLTAPADLYSLTLMVTLAFKEVDALVPLEGAHEAPGRGRGVEGPGQGEAGTRGGCQGRRRA